MNPRHMIAPRSPKPCRHLLAAFGLSVALAGAAHADPPSATSPLPGEMMANPATPEDLLHRSYLTGDPGNYRSDLQKKGVTFDLEYINDYFGIVQGDHPRGHDDDWGRVRLTIDVDFGKLVGLDGLSFHFSGLNQNGGNAGANIRSNANPSSLVSAETTRVDTYWLQQKLFNGVLVLRAGQLAQQDDYGVQEYGGSYLLEPLGYAYGNLFGDVNAQFDPASKPGVEIQVHPYGGFYAKAEFLNGQSNPYGNQDQHGVGFDTGGPGLLASEIGFRQDDPKQWPVYKPEAEAKDGKDAKSVKSNSDYKAGSRWFWEGTLPAVYKVGMYNNFGNFTDLYNGDRIHQNYLIYASVNQGIFRESHYGPGYFRGLDAFIGGDYSPDNESAEPWQITGGLRYTGLIPTRDSETLDFGFVVTHNSPALNTPESLLANGSITDETAFEVNYAVHVTGWLLVQPTLQYYINPGGESRRENALLLGARTKVVF
jgi:porin